MQEKGTQSSREETQHAKEKVNGEYLAKSEQRRRLQERILEVTESDRIPDVARGQRAADKEWRGWVELLNIYRENPKGKRKQTKYHNKKSSRATLLLHPKDIKKFCKKEITGLLHDSSVSNIYTDLYKH